MDNKEIGMAIRRARESMNPKMTQKQLALEIGKTESSIAKYEQGLVEIPLSVIVGIADALHIKAIDLLGSILYPSFIPITHSDFSKWLTATGYDLTVRKEGDTYHFSLLDTDTFQHRNLSEEELHSIEDDIISYTQFRIGRFIHGKQEEVSKDGLDKTEDNKGRP